MKHRSPNIEFSSGCSSNAAAGLLLLLIAGSFTLLCLWTPLAYDDWNFMAEWTEVNGTRPLSFATLFEFWKDIRLYDNGRIANVLAPVFTMFSPWKELFAFLTGLLGAGIVVFVSYFSFGRKFLTPLFLASVWVPLILLLPWRNSLFVTDYSLNYIWAAGVTMAFMFCVMYCERHGWNFFNFIFCLIIGFFAGGWHEGFAVPVLAGFFLLTIKERSFSIQWFLVGIFYLIVTLVFYFCPGMLNRTSEQIGHMALGMTYIKMAIDFSAVIFLCLTVVVFFIVPSLRKYLARAWSNPWFVIGSGIVLVGTILSLLFTHQPRSAFWPGIFAIAMFFILTQPLWTRLASSPYRVYLTVLASAVCLIPLCTTMVWQYRLTQEQKLILEKIEKSESGTVYHDIIKGSDIPAVLTLKMTNHPAWMHDFNYKTLKNYNHKPYTAVLPQSLENPANWLEPRDLEGNTGAFVVGNSVILPYDIGEEMSTIITVKLLEGTTLDAVALFLPFLSPQGIPYTYVTFYNTSLLAGNLEANEIEGLYMTTPLVTQGSEPEHSSSQPTLRISPLHI